MSHTPGPWKQNWIASGGCNIDPEDGHGRIATVRVRHTKTDNLTELEANARLIAAAPELLEAAKELLHNLQDADEDTDEDEKEFGDCKALREAIRKAEGATGSE